MDNNDSLHPDDVAALNAIRSGNEWLRAVLCTLARRGVQLRTEEPDRAKVILDALSVYPLYKAGQFLFDLMEWEDFMLDGPPPEVLLTTLDPRAMQRIASFLRDLQAHIEGGLNESSTPIDLKRLIVDSDESLPLIEEGFYLYRDVFLGLIKSVGPTLNLNAIELDL